MKCFLAFLLLQFGWLNIFGQSSNKIHGTVIVAGVVNDSVFMIADSRSTIAEDGGLPKERCNYAVAYIDSFPKIFKIKSYLIGTAGSGTIGSKSVDKIINDFNNRYVKRTSFEKTLYAFQNYIDSLYPISKYPESKGQLFIAAGYSIKKPQRIAFDRDTLKLKLSNFKSYGMISNDSRIFNYIQGKNLSSFSCNGITQMLKQAIFQLAKDIKHENCIGDPISIVKMTSPNNVLWLENDFSNRKYDSYTALLKMIKSNKVTLVPVVPNGRNRAIEILEKP